MILKQTLMLTLLSALAGLVHAKPWSLKELATQAYFTSRPLSVIKRDLESNKLNQEIQEVLVPYIKWKYEVWLEPLFSKKLEGHSGRVVSAAFDSDNKYVLTGSQDTTARLWDLSTGKTIKVLEGHTDEVLSVAFSPCGNYALTGSSDSTVRLWNVTTGQTIHIFTGHTNNITSVAFSLDGKYALTGALDGTAQLWDLKIGQTMQILRHDLPITSVAFSSDDNTQALTKFTPYNKAYLWNLTTGEIIKQFSDSDTTSDGLGSYNGLNSPDGKYVLRYYFCLKRNLQLFNHSIAHLWDRRYYTNTISLAELLSKINFFALEAPCTIV